MRVTSIIIIIDRKTNKGPPLNREVVFVRIFQKSTLVMLLALDIPISALTLAGILSPPVNNPWMSSLSSPPRQEHRPLSYNRCIRAAFLNTRKSFPGSFINKHLQMSWPQEK